MQRKKKYFKLFCFFAVLSVSSPSLRWAGGWIIEAKERDPWEIGEWAVNMIWLVWNASSTKVRSVPLHHCVPTPLPAAETQQALISVKRMNEPHGFLPKSPLTLYSWGNLSHDFRFSSCHGTSPGCLILKALSLDQCLEAHPESQASPSQTGWIRIYILTRSPSVSYPGKNVLMTV